MQNLNIHLTVSGYILIALGLAHVVFPKYFNWQKELTKLSLVNKQIMEVHTFFIALVLVLFGLLNLFEHNQLISTELGKTLSVGMALFWFIRLLFQFIVYSPKLWRGKTFETCMHVLFSVLWLYLTSLYLLVSFTNN